MCVRSMWPWVMGLLKATWQASIWVREGHGARECKGAEQESKRENCLSGVYNWELNQSTLQDFVCLQWLCPPIQRSLFPKLDGQVSTFPMPPQFHSASAHLPFGVLPIIKNKLIMMIAML